MILSWGFFHSFSIVCIAILCNVNPDGVLNILNFSGISYPLTFGLMILWFLSFCLIVLCLQKVQSFTIICFAIMYDVNSDGLLNILNFCCIFYPIFLLILWSLSFCLMVVLFAEGAFHRYSMFCYCVRCQCWWGVWQEERYWLCCQAWCPRHLASVAMPIAMD